MNQSLYESLKDGGYVLYARHGEATIGEDLLNLNFQKCATQRNLSDNGKAQAIYYGNILRYHKIPIHYPVQCSPFCRTIETAELAFGKQNISIYYYLYRISMLSNHLPQIEQQKILSNLTKIFEIIPPPGSNTMIIAHNFPEGIGLGQIPDMGTVVIRPLGKGNGYEVVEKLSLTDLALINTY